MDKYELLMKCYYMLNDKGKVNFDDYIENVIRFPDGMASLLFSMYVKKTDFAVLDNYFKMGKIYYAIKQAIIDNQQMSISDKEYYLKMQDEFINVIDNSYHGKYLKK